VGSYLQTLAAHLTPFRSNPCTDDECVINVSMHDRLQRHPAVRQRFRQLNPTEMSSPLHVKDFQATVAPLKLENELLAAR